MSRTRASRQRKRQGYATVLPRKAPVQGPVRGQKPKWAELGFRRDWTIQTVTAFTSLGILWGIDQVTGTTHFFGFPAWIGIGAYTLFRYFNLKRKHRI